MNEKIKRILPIALFIIIIGLLLWFSNRYINVSPMEIQQWIQSFGVWGPLLFILIYTFRPLILFPSSILSLAGGLAFGALQGFFYILIGATLSAIVAYFVSRFFEKSIVQTNEEGRIFKIRRLMEERGFFYVLILRLVPVINFDLISYSAGLANVKFRAFLLGTMVGIIPGTFGFSFIGSSFAEGNTKAIVISIIAGAVLLAFPILYRKKVAEWLGLESKS
ncbi:TVP38/TMEM64 family protein [Jeotgalibacillus proteolyticus]|uniref:TVP38/TMEM64 family membrane protein n=1 Tax=Jeotgalibacillus proteolyticus TaxID=2082395 RepID=A0A2S5GC42_9BACL|nr:TVP38/TMEM64 family protein [Jeotgalibacillus proteolyticus]PPA70566.1 TVP38/TMEM64 family protein [Jeotgalibacillus proteolyticus]